MSTDDRELEALLRRTLHEHAQKVVPTGDGLTKIQQRAANRRRRLVWLRPSIAVAAAAIAAVAAIAIPTAIHRMDNGNSGTEAGKQPTTTSAVTGRTRTSPKPSPTKKPQTTPAKTLAQVPMSWPYSSQQEAQRSGDASLQKPEQLATTFVASFIGSDKAKLLVASAPKSQGSALTVNVDRGTMLVSTVQLASIGQASYVVTGAHGTNVQLSESALRRTSNSITVSGTFKPDGQAANIWAGAGTPYDKSTATPITSAANVSSPWQVTLNPSNGTIASGPKILAAWSVDTNGQLLDFTATAAN